MAWTSGYFLFVHFLKEIKTQKLYVGTFDETFILYFLLADLKDPCGNDKYPPCHRDATCEDRNNITFLCICNKGFLGDGLTCEKKPAFTNIFYSDGEQGEQTVESNWPLTNLALL